MSLEKSAMLVVGSAEFPISRRGRDMVARAIEHFEKLGKEKNGVYHSLFLLHKALALGAINPKNYEDYQALLNGELPFHVERGRLISTEYYFGGKEGYRTKTRVFSSPREAFDPVDGVKN